MNLEKTRLRMLTAQEMGKELEEKLQAAERMVLKQEGAGDGLKQAAKGIGALMAAVDEEFEKQGKIGGFTVEELSGEPLRMMKAVKVWLQRSLGCVDNMATTAEMTKISTGGKVKGIQDAIAVIKKTFDEERGKLELVERGLKDGTIVVEDGQLVQKNISKDNPRTVGMPPEPTLKEQRMAEAGGVEQPQEAPPSEAKPKKPRKPRKAKEVDAGDHT